MHSPWASDIAPREHLHGARITYAISAFTGLQFAIEWLKVRSEGRKGIHARAGNEAQSCFLRKHDREDSEVCLWFVAFRNHDSGRIRSPVNLPDEHLFTYRELPPVVLVRELVITIVEAIIVADQFKNPSHHRLWQGLHSARRDNHAWHAQFGSGRSLVTKSIIHMRDHFF
jgi:hypothetical protein